MRCVRRCTEQVRSITCRRAAQCTDKSAAAEQKQKAALREYMRCLQMMCGALYVLRTAVLPVRELFEVHILFGSAQERLLLTAYRPEQSFLHHALHRALLRALLRAFLRALHCSRKNLFLRAPSVQTVF